MSKHIALNADTTAKFIIIASASRGTETQASNMQRTAQAYQEVSSLGRAIKGIELVTGFYAEQGQEGTFEQSMAITCESVTTMKAIKALFLEKYDQDCILVWNRDTNDVWLLMRDRKDNCVIGNHGMYRMWSSVAVAEFNKAILPDAYTIAADGSVWCVK